jgi:hypothetical protein
VSRLPAAPDEYDPGSFNQLIADLERATENSAGSAARNFTPTNSTKRRSFDSSTVTLAELAQVVATLIDAISDSE